MGLWLMEGSPVPAQAFEGTQRVSRLESSTDEDWRVEIVLQVVAACTVASNAIICRVHTTQQPVRQWLDGVLLSTLWSVVGVAAFDQRSDAITGAHNCQPWGKFKRVYDLELWYMRLTDMSIVHAMDRM